MDRLLLRVGFLFGAALVAGLLLAALAIFLCGLLYLWLVTKVTGLAAALITTVAALVLAAAIGGFGLFVGCRFSGLQANTQSSAEDELQLVLMQLLGRKIGSFVRSHQHETALASLIAGLAVGASAELRRTLRDILFR